MWGTPEITNLMKVKVKHFNVFKMYSFFCVDGLDLPHTIPQSTIFGSNDISRYHHHSIQIQRERQDRANVDWPARSLRLWPDVCLSPSWRRKTQTGSYLMPGGEGVREGVDFQIWDRPDPVSQWVEMRWDWGGLYGTAPQRLAHIGDGCVTNMVHTEPHRHMCSKAKSNPFKHTAPLSAHDA